MLECVSIFSFGVEDSKRLDLHDFIVGKGVEP